MNLRTRGRSALQRTLAEAIGFSGVAEHTRKTVHVTLRPGGVNGGIYFLRTDVAPGEGLIVARWYNVINNTRGTSLGNPYGVCVNGVDRLMGALRGCGIDNAVVEIDGPEVPPLGTGNTSLVKRIEKTGSTAQSAPRYAIWIQRQVEVSEGDRYAMISPYFGSRITVNAHSAQDFKGIRTLSVELVNEAFRHDVVRAHGYGLDELLDYLRQRDLIQGDPIVNAMLVDGERIIGEYGLRYAGGPASERILDTLGGLALAGVPIYGHLYTRSPGHTLTQVLLRALFNDESAWTYVSVDEFQALIERVEAGMRTGGKQTQTIYQSKQA